MKLNDVATYDSVADTLYIYVDKLGTDKVDRGEIMTSCPHEHRVFLDLNNMTGALIGVEILRVREIMDTEDNSLINYDRESDALVIPFADEDQDNMCDCLYHDNDSLIMISINRNSVGNLVGIDLLGMETILGSLNIQNN